MSVFDPFLRVFSFKNASAVGKQALVHTDDRLQVHAHVNPSGTPSRSLVNVDTRQEVYSKGAKTTAMLSADAVILATGGAYIDSVNVTVAGSAVGGLHNCATVLAADATNLIAVVPNTVGNTPVRSEFSVGCVYKVGTGQKIAYNGIIS